MPGLVHTGRSQTVRWGPSWYRNPAIKSSPKPNTGRPSQRKAKVPPGYIFLSCSSPKLNIQVRLGDDPFLPSAGWGGYDVVDRPQNVGMLVPKGVEPWQYSGSILFDGLKHMESQEDDIQSLLRCAHGDDDTNPGIITISGLPDLPADDWVIEDLGFDPDSVIRDNKTLDHVRLKISLTIRQYVAPDYLRISSNAFKRPKGKTTIITTKIGDTPHKIAVRQGCKWSDVQMLNPNQRPPITKANQKLEGGQRLRVPIKETKTHKTHRSSTKSTNRSGHG
ncbi:MAG TPA: hypothetical protein VNS88_07850 [Nitrospiraceae bacterium]|nr:hypothetical protein [Nitrospiraceae bacterium]